MKYRKLVVPLFEKNHSTFKHSSVYKLLIKKVEFF